jgi:hypothetical protein
MQWQACISRTLVVQIFENTSLYPSTDSLKVTLVSQVNPPTNWTNLLYCRKMLPLLVLSVAVTTIDTAARLQHTIGLHLVASISRVISWNRFIYFSLITQDMMSYMFLIIWRPYLLNSIKYNSVILCFFSHPYDLMVKRVVGLWSRSCSMSCRPVALLHHTLFSACTSK